MNVYRVFRYELKGFFYLFLVVFLLLLWESFFEDNFLRLDFWFYIGIAVLVVPFLYCSIRPISLMAVIRYLDSQLKLQQRLETFIENLDKKDDVISLQRKDTYHLLSAIDPRTTVKFIWPFEAKALPFVIFLICLLFAGKGLFDSERQFVTEANIFKKDETDYQVLKSPFKKSPQDISVKKNVPKIRENMGNTKKLFKVSTGNPDASTRLKLPDINQNASKTNISESKAIVNKNQQPVEEDTENNKYSSIKEGLLSNKDTKRLQNPDSKTDINVLKKEEIGKRSAKVKLSGSAFTETDSSNPENILNEKIKKGESSRVYNDNLSIGKGNGITGTGSSPAKKASDVTSGSSSQDLYVGDLGSIDEMISRNNIQPSLREYVKNYFLSLHVKPTVSD